MIKNGRGLSLWLAHVPSTRRSVPGLSTVDYELQTHAKPRTMNTYIKTGRGGVAVYLNFYFRSGVIRRGATRAGRRGFARAPFVTERSFVVRRVGLLRMTDLPVGSYAAPPTRADGIQQLGISLSGGKSKSLAPALGGSRRIFVPGQQPMMVVEPEKCVAITQLFGPNNVRRRRGWQSRPERRRRQLLARFGSALQRRSSVSYSCRNSRRKSS